MATRILQYCGVLEYHPSRRLCVNCMPHRTCKRQPNQSLLLTGTIAGPAAPLRMPATEWRVERAKPNEPAASTSPLGMQGGSAGNEPTGTNSSPGVSGPAITSES